jgi:hypothetical protein
MDNRLKAFVIVVVTLLVTLPVTVYVFNQGKQAGVNTARGQQPPRGEQANPVINKNSPYYKEQAPEFVDDPEVLGDWVSVDFVKRMEYFAPEKQQWTGDLFLKGLNFMPHGDTSGPWQWSKGVLWHPGDNSIAKYEIKKMNGAKYMFMEWVSGDVLIRGEAPRYYVLKRNS